MNYFQLFKQVEFLKNYWFLHIFSIYFIFILNQLILLGLITRLIGLKNTIKQRKSRRFLTYFKINY